MLCKIAVFLFALYTVQANNTSPPSSNFDNEREIQQPDTNDIAFLVADAIAQETLEHNGNVQQAEGGNKEIDCGCASKEFKELFKQTVSCSGKTLTIANREGNGKEARDVIKNMRTCVNNISQNMVKTMIGVNKNDCQTVVKNFRENMKLSRECRVFMDGLADEVKEIIKTEGTECGKKLFEAASAFFSALKLCNSDKVPAAS